MSQFAAKRLREEWSGSALETLLHGDVVLVPAPRSALPLKNGLWPAQRICDALKVEGFGSRVSPLLKRVKAVPKAAFAAPGERPSPNIHYGSMTVQAELGHTPTEIVVVDDVITRGAILLASVSLLRDAFPTSQVRAFAVVRTAQYGAEIERIADPCLGRITCTSGYLTRSP